MSSWLSDTAIAQLRVMSGEWRVELFSSA